MPRFLPKVYVPPSETVTHRCMQCSLVAGWVMVFARSLRLPSVRFIAPTLNVTREVLKTPNKHSLKIWIMRKHLDRSHGERCLGSEPDTRNWSKNSETSAGLATCPKRSPPKLILCCYAATRYEAYGRVKLLPLEIPSEVSDRALYPFSFKYTHVSYISISLPYTSLQQQSCKSKPFTSSMPWPSLWLLRTPLSPNNLPRSPPAPSPA